MLYRLTGNVLCCVPAQEPSPTMVRPIRDNLRREMSPMERPTMPAPGPYVATKRPGDDRPTPRLSFAPDECNPFRVWNVLGLGPFHEFDWKILLAQSKGTASV